MEKGGKRGKDKDKEPKEDEEDPLMKEYFEDVNTIQNNMQEIRRNLLTIEEQYGQSLVTMDLEQGASKSFSSPTSYLPEI